MWFKPESSLHFLRFGGILYLQYEIGGASMYRIAMEKLLKWKESKRRKPLIIEGARQVGKTWLMKEFGKLYYTDTVYINFDSNSRMAELFASDLDTDRLIMGLELYSGRKIDPYHTLLIFDEDSEKRNIAECIVAKNRHGETGKVELRWMPDYTSFSTLETRYEEQ